MPSYSEIAAALLSEGKANLQTLWQQIKDNFNAHQDRLNSLEAVSAFVPTGTIVWYGNDTVPFGYLACNGAVVSQADYPALYAAIGGAFSDGSEGAENFRLPDGMGRAPIGSGTGSGLSARTIGQKLGAETHVLSSGEMPAHTHPLTDPGHAHNWQHHNNYSGGASSKGVVSGSGANDLYTSYTTLNSQLTAAGGGGAHNNMMPSLCAGFVIKY